MVPPNIALLADQIKEIGAQLQLGRQEWFKRRGIFVKAADRHYILNAEGEINYWNIICNHITYNDQGFLVSCPPLKIANLENARVNLRNSILVEKIAGPMVSLCWPGGIEFAYCQTEGRITPLCDNDAIKKVFSRIKMDLLLRHNLGFSLTFNIADNEPFLVAGRCLRNLDEHSEDELDILAQRIGCNRPIRFSCPDGWVDVAKILRSHQENFIVRDIETGERAHVKLKIDRPKLLATCQYKYLLPYWQTRNHMAVIKEFPAARIKFHNIDAATLNVVMDVKEIAIKWKEFRLSRQGLMESLRVSDVPQWCHRIIMALQYLPVEAWAERIEEHIRKMTPKQLFEILKLDDKEQK